MSEIRPGSLSTYINVFKNAYILILNYYYFSFTNHYSFIHVPQVFIILYVSSILSKQFQLVLKKTTDMIRPDIINLKDKNLRDG
jgi:hypothetical protein